MVWTEVFLSVFLLFKVRRVKGDSFTCPAQTDSFRDLQENTWEYVIEEVGDSGTKLLDSASPATMDYS